MKFFFIIFFTFLFISSCSTTKIFYNYGEMLISWQIDNYFDLTNDQEEWIEEKSKLLLDWHRNIELPKYKDFLINIKENAKDGLKMKEIENIFSLYELKRDRIFEKIIPDTAIFLTTLSNEQINFLEKKMLKENENIKEKMINNKDGLKERKKYFFEYMENWFGELNENQIEKFNELQTIWYADSTKLRKDRNLLRLKSQKEFLSILRSKPSNKKLDTWLRKWTFSMIDNSNQKRNLRIERNKKRILAIDKIITTDQRLHAIREIDYWIKIIEETIENS